MRPFRLLSDPLVGHVHRDFLFTFVLKALATTQNNPFLSPKKQDIQAPNGCQSPEIEPAWGSGGHIHNRTDQPETQPRSEIRMLPGMPRSIENLTGRHKVRNGSVLGLQYYLI
jgi:hypothetical protein